MSKAERLLQSGCQELQVKPEDVKIISDALMGIMEGASELTSIATALQIIQAGGVDDHNDHMTPGSAWCIEIYPKLKKAIGDHMAGDVENFYAN